MRILHVADSFDIGGAERVVVSDAIGLKAMGHDVTVACSPDGRLREAAIAGGVETIVCGSGRVKREVSNDFARALDGLSQQFDIVHSHMYASHAAAYRAPHLGDVRILTEHSEATWRQSAHVEESRRFFAGATAIIGVSQRIAERLVHVDGVSVDRVMTISNALPLLPQLSHSCPRFSHRAGPIIGVVSRLYPEKGVQTFVDAAATVSRTFPWARFVIAGDGPERENLERRARELCLERRLCFAGFLPDGPAVIRQLDLLVVPSLTEGTPLVVLEAMASGVAVVATRVGGIPEQVRHQREALLVAAGDAPAMAAACTRLLTDEPLRSRLIIAARRRLDCAFNNEHRLGKLEALYRHALTGRPLAEIAMP